MNMLIGAQLYTLRDYCKNLPDFAETLKKVADMGYTTVQVSGTCAYEGEWLDRELKKNGLACVITHYPPQKIAEETDETVRLHNAFGCRYIGIGSAPGGLNCDADYEHFRDTFLPAARQMKKSGNYLMYHNHHMEFAKDAQGKRYLERMMEDFAPDEMGFTLDTYWVQYAGGDSVEWMQKLHGRMPCIHLKDMAVVQSQQRMAPVGEGNINFEKIIAEAEKAGTEYLLVEQDDCYEVSPFECLRRSAMYLRSLGLK